MGVNVLYAVVIDRNKSFQYDIGRKVLVENTPGREGRIVASSSLTAIKWLRRESVGLRDAASNLIELVEIIEKDDK